MKQFKYKIILTAVIFIMSAFTAGNLSAKPTLVPKMYIFGFAASFSDTIVYFTPVIEVDNVWIESKNKFLLGRQLYSRQLRDYLGSRYNLPLRTCIVMFDQKRTKAEKKLLKMKKLYTKGKDGKPHFDLRYLEDGEFQFKTIDWSSILATEENANSGIQAAPIKKKKKKKK